MGPQVSTVLFTLNVSEQNMADVIFTVEVKCCMLMMKLQERFYIFQETKINNQINDRLTIKLNIIFEIIGRKDPHRGLPAAY